MTVAAIPTGNGRDCRHRRSPQNPAQNWHLRHKQTLSGGLLLFGKQHIQADRTSTISHVALHAAAARTSTYLFIVIMVTPTSFLRKSGPVVCLCIVHIYLSFIY